MNKSDWLREQREAKSSRGGKSAGDETINPPRVVTTSGSRPLERMSRAKLPAGVTPSPREAKPGRPLDVDKAKTLTAIKPWIAAGMSRRTWYRRRAEKRAQ